MKISNIRKYIEIYGESYLFKVIGPAVKEKGYFLFNEFYEVCMWKSARQKKRYIQNKNIIEEVSRKALAEENERKKMEILSGELDGVGIPTASALLTVVYPKRYAVIDIRCLEMLRKMKCDIGRHPSLNIWEKYLKIMREWSKENSITPRELDMALFAMHREDLNNQDYRNLRL